jgi:hypothetical protein
MRWQRGLLVAGLLVAAAGAVVMISFLHRHQVCIAPNRAPMAAGAPAPSGGNCWSVNVLFYLGMGGIALGAVVIVGAIAVRHRRR